MLPLLAVPYFAQACLGAMTLWVRFGPGIMAMLTEGPVPIAPAARVGAQAAGRAVAQQAARPAGDTVRQQQAVNHWWNLYGKHLRPDQMRSALDVVKSTAGDPKMLDRHIETHAKYFADARPARPAFGKDITQMVDARRGPSPREWFPLKLGHLATTRSAELLRKYNLTLVKSEHGPYWEIKRGNIMHLCYMPNPSSFRSAQQFEHWLVDVLRAHNMN